MLNFLLTPRFLISAIISFAAISYGYYWHHEYNKSQATISQLLEQNASCKASHDLLESAVQRWKSEAKAQETRLRRTEADIARKNIESKKRIRELQQRHFSTDCNTAIKQGIEEARKFN